MQKLPQSEIPDKVISLTCDPLPVEGNLGVCWYTEQDTLKFQSHLDYRPDTRRGVLASVATVFEPLILLSAFTLVARIKLLYICRKVKGLDDGLGTDEKTRWHTWKRAFIDKDSLWVPRQILFPSDSGEVLAQLHLFGDASEVGYDVAAYVSCEINENRWVCNLLLAKSRVAPIKKVTVPRLELTAAVLARRLYRMIESQINAKFEKVMFRTDSVLVLRYIRNTSARFVTFVAHRVQE